MCVHSRPRSEGQDHAIRHRPRRSVAGASANPCKNIDGVARDVTAAVAVITVLKLAGEGRGRRCWSRPA